IAPRSGSSTFLHPSHLIVLYCVLPYLHPNPPHQPSRHAKKFSSTHELRKKGSFCGQRRRPKALQPQVLRWEEGHFVVKDGSTKVEDRFSSMPGYTPALCIPELDGEGSFVVKDWRPKVKTDLAPMPGYHRRIGYLVNLEIGENSFVVKDWSIKGRRLTSIDARNTPSTGS
ncbi:hypothetical protein AVEN_3036-1, partial [Araneus ventricosus]